MKIVAEYKVCHQCLIAEANGDMTSLSDEEVIAVDAGFERIANAHLGCYFIADGEEFGFCTSECECCGALPGDRFKLVLASLEADKSINPLYSPELANEMGAPNSATPPQTVYRITSSNAECELAEYTDDPSEAEHQRDSHNMHVLEYKLVGTYVWKEKI